MNGKNSALIATEDKKLVSENTHFCKGQNSHSLSRWGDGEGKGTKIIRRQQNGKENVQGDSKDGQAGGRACPAVTEQMSL